MEQEKQEQPKEEKKAVEEKGDKEEKVEKKEEKKPEKKKEEKPKKEEAVVNAKDIEISTKVAVAICNLIRNKKPQKSVEILEKVLKKELAIPYVGEIPHRKRGHRIGKKLSGRYPKKASKIFIKILKNLIANASINGLDIEKIIITKAFANKASRPIKPTRIAYGRKSFKRTHILLIAKEEKKAKETKEPKEKEIKK